MVTTRTVELIADYGPGDEAFDELVRRVEAALADITIHLTRVSAGDTLEAGRCVARLALAPGAAGRVVMDDVAGADEAQRCLCLGRTKDGALVVGRDDADCWRYVAEALETLCTLELPLSASSRERPEVLAKVIARVFDRHPHAVREPVPWARPGRPR